MNGADLLVRCLMDRGVRFVTTLSGNGMDPFYEACRNAGLRLVDFRNEQAAAFAADAAARLEKRLAVCAVNATVGHANAIVGLVNAAFAGSPMLLLSGAAPHAQADVGRFQDMDHVPIVAPICKYARTVERAERIPFYVHEACSRATAGRPGPVHLTIAADVLKTEVDAEHGWSATAASGTVRPLAAPDPHRIAEAATLLAQAKRPVMVAGSGGYFAGAEQVLNAFAAKLRIPVVVPIWDQGTIPEAADHFVGFIGAAYGGPRLLPEADVLLLVGARIDYRTGFGQAPGLDPRVRIVRIDIEPEELVQGREPDVAILADPASALTALTAEVERQGIASDGAWLAEARRRWGQFRSPWTGGPPPSDTPLTGHHIVEAIRPHLGKDLLFLIDGGNIGQWAHMALGDHYSANWLTCGPSGVVGWGVSGAIAAKLARPDQPALLLSGDGAIGFCLMELETAVRNDTPFVVVLADDQEWGSVVTGQERTYGAEGVVASRLGRVAYDDVARGLGADGRRVEGAAALGAAIAEGLASGRPTLIHVPIQGSAPKGGDAI
jgi:acetolactate synthase-1/2/3 large subunit